jgi:transposase
MSTRFVTVDRNTAMLLPPDLRDWVRPDDPVHLVLALVEALPAEVFRVNERGTGSKQYPPSMMLALLVYCYSKQIFSSRRIEQSTYENVSVRYLTGDTHPDHDTIAAFRRNNVTAIAACFTKALLYARETGLLKLGAISVDGTLMRANASKYRNVRHDELDAVEAYLAEQVQQLLAQAEAMDCEEDDSDGLPPELAERRARQERVRQAREKIEARAREKRENKRANKRRFRRSAEAEPRAAERPRDPRGRKEGPLTPKASASANLTDVDSRLLRRDPKSSFEQSYNAQAVADADGSQLILAARVADAATDINELLPDLHAIPEDIGEFAAVLADSGFANQDHVEALEAHGKEVYVSVRSEHRPRHPKLPASTNPRGLSNLAKSSFGQRMREKLSTEQGKALYKRRRQSVESCFGIIKHVLGFRQFHLRGLAKVNLEWNLVALAYNIKMIGCARKRTTGKNPSPAPSAPRSYTSQLNQYSKTRILYRINPMVMRTCQT